MARKFDPNEWAENTPLHKRRCMTCTSDCEREGITMLECIRVVMVAMSEVRSTVSQSQLHSLLVERFGFRLQVSALRNHMRICEPDLWHLTWGKRE